MTEPVALSDIKTHLRLDQGATDEDSYLTILLTAARRACEGRIHRAVVGTSAIATFDRFPLAPIGVPLEVPEPDALYLELEGGTVASITSILYYDGTGSVQTLDPASYVVDLDQIPARVAPLEAWPTTMRRPNAIKISYVLSPLPLDDLAAVKQAIFLLVENWYSNRGAAVVDIRGVPTELPLAVTWLLWPLTQFATS
ncbi:head-tail connector protein [Sphingomonas echinoides]|uniref:Phage head-tail connector protein n=1 Tax=Sphingomonas echinoides TaxID=59803 RepID=A0ABU4PLH2_9SPHN|nr:phage head-tail connector protein [Sphingomonas echinoides]MDX5984692.1 phage head-tail connector protein [Sphingomonas echinoides]